MLYNTFCITYALWKQLQEIWLVYILWNCTFYCKTSELQGSNFLCCVTFAVSLVTTCKVHRNLTFRAIAHGWSEITVVIYMNGIALQTIVRFQFSIGEFIKSVLFDRVIICWASWFVKWYQDIVLELCKVIFLLKLNVDADFTQARDCPIFTGTFPLNVLLQAD